MVQGEQVWQQSHLNFAIQSRCHSLWLKKCRHNDLFGDVWPYYRVFARGSLEEQELDDPWIARICWHFRALRGICWHFRTLRVGFHVRQWTIPTLLAGGTSPKCNLHLG
jgi:hypothetical protein